MTIANIAVVQAAARIAAFDLDLDDLDPDEIETLATDGAWDWVDLYGAHGERVYVEAFSAAALERLGL